MNIFKYLIKNAKRDWDFGDICYYAKMYRKMIEEMYEELIMHRDEIKNILENKKKEEFYK